MAGQESDDARQLMAVKFSRLARRGLLLGLDLAQVIVLGFALATLVGALSFLPGGLGGCEAVMWWLLIGLSMTRETAAQAVTVFRFCSLWLGTLVGVAFLLVWLRVMGQERAPGSLEEPP